MNIYLAGPLFSEAEQNWLLSLKKQLQTLGYNVIWPYELFDQSKIAAWGANAAQKIMETDRDALAGCDLIVALLDGAQVDDGTAWELGYAHAKNIPSVGIRTDFRHAGETASGKVNAMIAGSCPIYCSQSELLNWLQNHYPSKA